MIEPAAEAAPTVQGEAISIGPAVEADSVIWTVRLRTGRVVTFRASVSKDFRAADLIAPVAAGDSVVVIASVAARDLVAVDLAGSADSVAEDFAAAAAAGSEVGDEN
jgi:hypothetical protein